jgi:hypothetical protein
MPPERQDHRLEALPGVSPLKFAPEPTGEMAINRNE